MYQDYEQNVVYNSFDIMWKMSVYCVAEISTEMCFLTRTVAFTLPSVQHEDEEVVAVSRLETCVAAFLSATFLHSFLNGHPTVVKGKGKGKGRCQRKNTFPRF